MNDLSTVEFLSYLRRLDVNLSAEGDRLRINAPAGVMSPEVQEELAARKTELLDFLKEASLGTRLLPPPIDRTPRDKELPLSFAQMRLWLLDRLSPETATYIIQECFRLKGEFNLAAFEQSLTDIVRRHEALRTCFLTVDGRPVQKIAPPEPFQICVVDLQGLPEAAQQEAARLALADARRPFDLSKAPLIRATLLKLAAEEQVLLLMMHHIVFDEWSFGVFERELSVLYKAFLRGQASPLPELPIQYADFAVWQREWLQGEVLQAQLDYWKEKLGGNLPVLELPMDRPRPGLLTHNGSIVTFLLSPDLAERLKTLSRLEGTTLFVTLLAAFKVLLLRYTGQEDLLVGTPIANRSRPEIEGLIGFFVNTLVMRSDLSGNPSFRELLKRVQETALGAYAHQDLPFEKLVQELNPERDLSRSQILQVLFSFLNTPTQPFELPGLEPIRIKSDNGTSKFDLSLYAIETPEGVSCTFEYNTDLFNADRIGRMVEHLQTLLEGIAAHPEQRLSELPLLPESEKHRLLVEYNDTATDFPRDMCIHQLFEEQVERTPNQVAVVFNDQQLTYRELNERANQLAHYLRGLGVGPEVLVGICMERSIEMVVGVLGILKAGGGYMPLDSRSPVSRLAIILEDAQVSLLLTQARLVGQLSAHGVQIVRVDADRNSIAVESRANPLEPSSPQNLAYVLYTSGSTGQPKGVAIEHRNTVAFIRWAQGVFPPEDLAGVLFSTSLCFDLSVFELFVTLSTGGCVIGAENALELNRLPAAEKVTLINTVPSAIAELVRQGGWPARLRTVNLAGEPLSNKLAQLVYGQSTVEHVYNLYGPTEDTTYSTWVRVEKGANQEPTIGRPISNCQAYILDRQIQPVPVGIAGELYLGGAGLARGYWKRPDLTAAQFVVNPFSSDPAARLYKTGDLARYRADGNIEFLGRVDRQVKIRGFRIELGEIENVLRGHSGVREAVVVVREEREKQLVAYVVAEGESGSMRAELLEYLKQKLPGYMVPATCIVLPELPLTPNGKVDHKALPLAELQRSELPSNYVAPRTEIEKTLARIWEDVLGAKDVGVHDDFFRLGGHSLRAVSLISEVERVFGMRFPLISLFIAPTIAQLSDIVRRKQSLRGKSPKLIDPGTIAQQVRGFIVENYLDGVVNGLKDSDSFLEHGIIDPMRLYELIEFLEETYGITLENDALTGTNLNSINNLSRFLCERLNGEVRAETPEVAERIVTRD